MAEGITQAEEGSTTPHSGSAKARAKRLQERISTALYEAETLQGLYDSIVGLCLEETGAQASALFLESEDGAWLQVISADGYGKNLLREAASYRRGEGITGMVWDTGMTVKCNSYQDMIDHPSHQGKYDSEQWPEGTRCENLLFVAIRRGRHVFGVIKVENKHTDAEYVPISEDDIETMELIATGVSLGLNHARLTENRLARPNQNAFAASVLDYPTSAVEVFLNVDPRHHDGPLIERDGCSAPRMKIDDWYRENPSAWDDLPRTVRERHKDLASFLAQVEAKSGYSTDPEEWPRGIPVREQLRQLEQAYPGFEILAIQSVGDLTMNLFTMGVVNGKLILPTGEQDRARKAASENRNGSNRYSCLVKTTRGMNRVAIRDIEVRCEGAEPDITVLDGAGNPSGLELGDIEMAIAGQQLLKDGEVVDLKDLIDRFGDLRHVFALPRLQGCYYGVNQSQDIYFGEVQFAEDPELARQALKGPVRLSTQYQPAGSPPLGATVDEVARELNQAGYRSVAGRAPSRAGEYTLPSHDDTNFLIWLKQPYYPLTMVGLDARRDTLYLLAISGQSGRFSLTLPAAAALLRDRFGVADAILVDEGADVFQQVGDQQPIQMTRRQVRAVIAVARK